MKDLKPYKVTDTSILYKVKDPAQITPALVKSLDWPAEKRALGIDFKPRKMDPARPLVFRLPAGYTSKTACYSPAGGIRVPAVRPAVDGIETRPPKSLAELRRVSAMDDRIFLKLWRKKLSAKAAADYETFVDKHLTKLNALIAFRKGKPCGLFAHLKHKGVSGKTYDALTSWNLFPGLSPAERRSALYQSALWLKKSARRQVSVTVGYYEKDLLKFFAGLGFTTCRVVIERV